MIAIMEREQTGETKEVPLGISWTILFFGFFVPLFRGHWSWFFIMFILDVSTGGLARFIVMFMYNDIYKRYLMGKGFKVKYVT